MKSTVLIWRWKRESELKSTTEGGKWFWALITWLKKEGPSTSVSVFLKDNLCLWPLVCVRTEIKELTELQVYKPKYNLVTPVKSVCSWRNSKLGRSVLELQGTGGFPHCGCQSIYFIQWTATTFFLIHPLEKTCILSVSDTKNFHAHLLTNSDNMSLVFHRQALYNLLALLFNIMQNIRLVHGGAVSTLCWYIRYSMRIRLGWVPTMQPRPFWSTKWNSPVIKGRYKVAIRRILSRPFQRYLCVGLQWRIECVHTERQAVSFSARDVGL